MSMETPKAFISHASEDKQRFVIDFAKALLSGGVNAWLDQWEMKPGDSLVDKIFHEGIRDSDVIIVVISQYSINKSWVREEINAGFMKRIAGKAKIIPVIIDECEIPEVLQSTLYERINDLLDYESSLKKILSAIFNISDKPAIGIPPQYVLLEINKLPGLTSIDSHVFKTACEVAIQEGQAWVGPGIFQSRIGELGIPLQDVTESLEILEDRYLIETSRTFDGHIPLFKISINGFENYGKFYIDDFDDLIKQVMLSIVNDGLHSNGVIANHLGRSSFVIEFVLNILKERRLLKIGKYMGSHPDTVIVHEVTSQGKRFVEKIAR